MRQYVLVLQPGEKRVSSTELVKLWFAVHAYLYHNTFVFFPFKINFYRKDNFKVMAA